MSDIPRGSSLPQSGTWGQLYYIENTQAITNGLYFHNGTSWTLVKEHTPPYFIEFENHVLTCINRLVIDNTLSGTVVDTELTLGQNTAFIELLTTNTPDTNTTSATAIEWTSTAFTDSQFFTWDNSTSTLRKQTKVLIAGTYLIQYQFVPSMDDIMGTRHIRGRIRKNGSTFLTTSAGYCELRANELTANNVIGQCMATLAQNDYIELLHDRIGSSGTATMVANESYLRVSFVR